MFDTTQSGCELTWKYLYADHCPVPAILRYVGDRDLWKFELEMSEEVNLAIAAMKEDFAVWEMFDLQEAV